MRFFKWIFRLTLSLIILAIMLVAIPLFLMYKDVKPPKYQPQEELNFETLINDELEKLFDPSNIDKTINFSLEEDFINAEIYEMLVSVLEDNLSRKQYVLAEFEDMVFFQGAWVTFSDDTLSINSGVHFKYQGITFKTRVLINLKIVGFEDGELVFKISKLNIGNLPLKWMVRIAPEIYRLVTGDNINELINSYIGDVLLFDRRTQSFKINISSLITTFIEGSELMNSVFQILSTDNFLDINIVKTDNEYHFNASLNFQKLLSDKEATKLDEDDKLTSEQDLEDFTYDKLLEGIILEKIRLDSKEITILIDYMMLGSLGDADHLIHQELYLDYEIKVLRPYFEVTDKAVLNFPVLIGKEDNYLKSNISLEIRFVKVNNDLKLYFSNIHLGEILINDEMLALLLGTIDLEEMKFDGDSFLITDFFLLFKTKDIQISHINVVDNKVNINFHKLKTKDILDEIVNEFPNVIVKDVTERIIDKILSNEDIEEELDELLDIYDSLSKEEQDALFHIINKYL